MNRYSTEEMDGEWEFKIVRSETGAFRQPENFQRLLDEEAVAGWQLMEKLDNKRVRLKRHVSSRSNDMMLPQGIDPYRTQFGGGGAGIWVGAGIMLAVLIGVVTMLFVGGGNGQSAEPSGSPAVIMPIIALLIGVVLMVFVIVQKRMR